MIKFVDMATGFVDKHVAGMEAADSQQNDDISAMYQDVQSLKFILDKIKAKLSATQPIDALPNTSSHTLHQPSSRQELTTRSACIRNDVNSDIRRKSHIPESKIMSPKGVRKGISRENEHKNYGKTDAKSTKKMERLPLTPVSKGKQNPGPVRRSANDLNIPSVINRPPKNNSAVNKVCSGGRTEVIPRNIKGMEQFTPKRDITSKQSKQPTPLKGKLEKVVAPIKIETVRRLKPQIIMNENHNILNATSIQIERTPSFGDIQFPSIQIEDPEPTKQLTQSQILQPAKKLIGGVNNSLISNASTRSREDTHVSSSASMKTYYYLFEGRPEKSHR